MQGYTIVQLRTFLQSVRGETRVKTKEEGIRNQFLQSAVDEIFTDHSWPFNRRSVAVSSLTAEMIDVEDPDNPGSTISVATGRFEAPSDFSMFNDYYTGTKDEKTVEMNKADIVVDQEGEKTYLTFPRTASYPLVYHILAPRLIDSNTAQVFFPQPILIAERAFVRLKTAYFPDEESDKELARSKTALRQLYKESVPKKNFTSFRW